MRTGSLWMRAGLGMALLLSINAARAQGPEPLAPPAGGRQMVVPPPSSFSQYPVDQPMAHEEHGEHEEHHAECGECNHEEGRGLFLLADFLYVRPRRRALDFAIHDPVLDNVVNGKVESLDWDTTGAYRLGAGYRLGSDRGNPNHGSTLASKRVMPQMRSPARVST